MWSVLPGEALGKLATGVFHKTGRDAITIHTGVLIPTLCVTLAAHRLTGYLRVTHVARRTDTDGMMFLDEAGRSRATVTGVHTLSVNARVVSRTVIVPGTARWIGQGHGLTGGISVGHPALPTRTDHSSEGKTVDYSADCCYITGRECKAWVLTTFVEASSVVRTVAIHITLWFWVRYIRGQLRCT